MKVEQVTADVELRYGERRIRLKSLVDTGTSTSLISRRLSEKVGSFIPLRKPYELKTADKEGKLRVIGQCLVEVTFQNFEVPGRVLFDVAENLRDDIDLVIGRPEIEKWGIIFIPEGPRPKKVPIEFEVI